ncbi:MAG: carbon-nitrogen hydrolase [Thermoleophilia bacterium]|nr:carbon-nitrogen hydrolase [Thermoleophilia bacterium]
MTTEPFTVAAVEFNPVFGELEPNIARAAAVAREAASAGARLIVMPEAAVSGYIYRDRQQFEPFLDTVPGKATDAIAEVTREFGCHVAIGIAEVDPDTTLAYNAGVLIGPHGYIGKYRKNGLNPTDQLWFAPGDTGYPVFHTELGRICMVICYDDTYWEPARIPAITGADIIAYICASDRVLERPGVQAPGNHSTIAAVQQLSAWNGLAMVAADRNNLETNPLTGESVFYGGAASIWQATGERVAHAPCTDANTTAGNPGRILYAQIDPNLFDNPQKRTLQWRRPDLYGDLALFRSPTDARASTQAHRVRAAAVQVRQEPGQRTACAAAVQAAVDPLAGGVDLVVLPAFTFTGPPAHADAAVAHAEPAEGPSQAEACAIAERLGAHVVASHVERDGGDLFHRAVLVAPDGRVVGAYRQAHLDPVHSAWATAGDDLPVFDAAIGRIGLLLCEDARFPEAAAVLAVRRADIIAIPTWWDGSYGAPLHDAAGLFAHDYPANTMCMWYAIAKTAQAYTIVANAVGGGAIGDSGIFTINPVDSQEPPITAPSDEPGVARLAFSTLGDPGWWMNQHRMLGGRRVDYAAPVAFPPGSAALARLREDHGEQARCS